MKSAGIRYFHVFSDFLAFFAVISGASCCLAGFPHHHGMAAVTSGIVMLIVTSRDQKEY